MKGAIFCLVCVLGLVSCTKEVDSSAITAQQPTMYKVEAVTYNGTVIETEVTRINF